MATLKDLYVANYKAQESLARAKQTAEHAEAAYQALAHGIAVDAAYREQYQALEQAASTFRWAMKKQEQAYDHAAWEAKYALEQAMWGSDAEVE